MRVEPSGMMPGCNVASIIGLVDKRLTKCGEVYLYDNGSATVYDDLWGGAPAYFEGADAHHQAVKYVVTRIIEKCELVW